MRGIGAPVPLDFFRATRIIIAPPDFYFAPQIAAASWLPVPPA
jgi:hypothetical protein